MPTYLNYKYIFFFHFELSSDLDFFQLCRIRIFFSAEPDPDPRNFFNGKERKVKGKKG